MALPTDNTFADKGNPSRVPPSGPSALGSALDDNFAACAPLINTTNYPAGSARGSALSVAANSNGSADNRLSNVLVDQIPDSQIDALADRLEPVLGPPPYIYTSRYATLALADTAAVDQGLPLYIDAQAAVPADAVIVSDYFIAESGAVSISSGKVLTMRGRPINDPTHLVYVGAGTVIGLRRCRPEMFGWKTSATADENTTAWAAMVAAMDGASAFDTPGDGNRIILSAGIYSVRTMPFYPTVYDQFSIEGAGQTIGGTTINFYGSSPNSAGLWAVPSSPNALSIFSIIGLNLVNKVNCSYPLKVGATGANYFTGLENSLISDILVQGDSGASTTAVVQLINTRLLELNRVTINNPIDGVRGLQIVADGTGRIMGDCRYIDVQCNTPIAGTSVNSGAVDMIARNGGGLTGNRFENCTFYHGAWDVKVSVDVGCSVSETWFMSCQFEGSAVTNNFGAITVVLMDATSSFTTLYVDDQCWINAKHASASILIANPFGAHVDSIKVHATFRNCWGSILNITGAAGVSMMGNVVKDCGFPLNANTMVQLDDCVNPVLVGIAAYSTTGLDGYETGASLTGTTDGARVSAMAGPFSVAVYNDLSSGTDNQFLDFVEDGSIGSAMGDISNVTGQNFGSKLVAISAPYAPRPATIGRATATFDVEDYYPSVNPSRTDHDAALTAAVAALNANGSGRLLCRRPLSGLTTEQVVTASFAELRFSRSDTITKASLGGNLFTITGQHVVMIDPFFIGSSSATSGYFAAFTNVAGQSDVHGMRSTGGWSAVLMSGGETTIYDARCYNLLKDFIRFSDAYAGQARVAMCRGGAAPSNANTGVGLYLTSGDTVVVTDFDATSFQIGVLAKPVANTFLRNVDLANLFGDGFGRTDSANAKAIVIDATNTGAEISRIVGVNTWGSASAGSGMEISGNVKMAQFNQHRGLVNGKHGVHIIAGTTNPQDIWFRDAQNSGNSQSSVGSFDDFHVDDGIGSIFIEGGLYGFSDDLTVLGLTNKAARPINFVGTTHANYLIEPDKVVPGTVGGISDNGSGSHFTSEGVAGKAEGNWTPTITSQTGSITTVGAVSGHYQRIGRLLIGSVTINITTIGTAAGTMNFTLPITARTGIDNVGSGREQSVNGKGVEVNIPGGATVGAIKNYDNTDAWVNGGRWYCSFQYWI